MDTTQNKEPLAPYVHFACKKKLASLSNYKFNRKPHSKATLPKRTKLNYFQVILPYLPRNKWFRQIVSFKPKKMLAYKNCLVLFFLHGQSPAYIKMLYLFRKICLCREERGGCCVTDSHTFFSRNPATDQINEEESFTSSPINVNKARLENIGYLHLQTEQLWPGKVFCYYINI